MGLRINDTDSVRVSTVPPVARPRQEAAAIVSAGARLTASTMSLLDRATASVRPPAMRSLERPCSAVWFAGCRRWPG